MAAYTESLSRSGRVTVKGQRFDVQQSSSSRPSAPKKIRLVVG